MVRQTLMVAAVLALLSGSLPSAAVDANTNLSRAEIRAMPIQERPNRPGHFYGNTVRRRASRH